MGSDPSFATEGSRSFPSLRGASEMPFVTEDVTLDGAQGVVEAGTVLGHITDGNWVPVDDALTNGAEVARAVLAEDTDTSDGAIEATVYRTGVFATSELIFGGDDVLADHKDAMAAKGIFAREVTAV